MPPRLAKRKVPNRDVIDLTGDDEITTRQNEPENSPNKKKAKTGTGNPSSTGQAVPTSSQDAPQASFREPEYLDLTQDSDEPELELYGSFCTSPTP